VREPNGQGTALPASRQLDERIIARCGGDSSQESTIAGRDEIATPSETSSGLPPITSDTALQPLASPLMSTTGFADAASADSPTSAMPPTFASSTVPVAGTVTCAPAGWLPTIGSDVVVPAELGSANANAATGSDLSLPVRLRRVRLPLSIVRNAVESTVNAAYPFGTVTTVPAVS